MSAIEPNAQQAPTAKKPIILVVIFGAIGLGLAWGAWSMAAEVRTLAASGVRAEAQVVSVDQYRNRGTVSYVPTFSFRTADGRVVRERSSETLSSNEEFAGGRRVAVIYDPADTSRVRLASSVAYGVGALPWVLGVLALVCWGIAAIGLFKRPSS